MKSTDIPAKFIEAFAQNAGTQYIRAIPQTSTDPNVASLDLGFPPNTATPVAAGGTPPDIKDFNGLFHQITLWSQWQAAAGPVGYDAGFQTNIGGYPMGAILSKAATLGHYWISTADDNMSDPDTGGEGWTEFTYIGLAPINSPTFTGDPKGPTPAPGDNDTSLATTAFVTTACNAILSTAESFATTQANNALASALSQALLRVNNLGDLNDAAVARSNLGLKQAATKDVSNNAKSKVASVAAGTTINNVATFDDVNGTVKDSGVAISSIQIPPGAIFWFVASAPPTGYFICDGTAVSRTTYAALNALASAAGYAAPWGPGNGTTTFNLPDLRGYFIRGWDDGAGVDPGRVFGSQQADDNKAHSHTVAYGDVGGGTPSTGTSDVAVPSTIPTSSSGGNEARPKNVALLPCIKI